MIKPKISNILAPVGLEIPGRLFKPVIIIKPENNAATTNTVMVCDKKTDPIFEITSLFLIIRSELS
jgi:hypothetical protein